MSRVYLDWNATAPLRAEARDAMIAAMDVVGNPSSVHAEGRAAKGIVETARGQVADLVGIDRSEVVFTSGATESAAFALEGKSLACADIEHEAVRAHQTECVGVDRDGFLDPGEIRADVLGVQASNSETGVLQNNFALAQKAWASEALVLVDAVQSAGRFGTSVADLGADFLMLSAHKFGGPKGVGALCLKLGVEVASSIKGGGQEMGRRSGTENIIGIAGMGAAAVAAQRDLDAGVWERVSQMRDAMEEMLMDAAPDLVVFGKDAPRLPNTSNFAIPGWRAETQVMQMDLAGFAVSAGSACASGKVKESRVLRAMGFDNETASSAIRVSMGPTTKTAEVTAFADTWIDHYRRFKRRAA